MKSLAAFALAAALATAACSDSAGPEADRDILLSEDVAFSSGAAISGDVAEQVGGSATLIAGPVRPGGAPRAFDRPDCPYSATTGWHECAATTPRGLSVSHAYAFFTAAGESQENFDATTTESIESRMSIEGTLTTERFTAT